MAVLLDVDGTCLEGVRRHKFVVCEPEKRDWKKFYANVINDTSIKFTYLLASALFHFGIKIVLLTGRPKRDEEVTRKCLRRHHFPFHELYLREDDDNREDYIYKKEKYLSEIKDKYNIIFAVDDRLSVIKTFTDLGIPCLYYANPNSASYEALADVFYGNK